MNYTPADIIDFIQQEHLEQAFFSALSRHVAGYSIGEICDSQFQKRAGDFYLVSKGYHLNLKIEDAEIHGALESGQYVSAFLSRYQDAYQVHFLIHRYPRAKKSQYEEEILQEVLRYMILKTVRALRLDTPEKVQAYCYEISGQS
jgi:hypothetical protein